MKTYKSMDDYYRDLAAKPEPRRHEPRRYLNQAEVAERIGVAQNSLGRAQLPPADAVTGPINADGSLPRGTVRGWLPSTIDEWQASRPGRGARTDLRD